MLPNSFLQINVMNNQLISSNSKIVSWKAYTLLLLILMTLCWLGTNQFLNTRINSLIKEKTAANEQSTVHLAQSFSLTLNNLHSIPTLVARDEGVLSALSHINTNKYPAKLAAETQKKIWSDDLQLKTVDNYLSLVASSMSVDVVYIINKEGNCVASSNVGNPDSFVGTNYSNREYFQEAMAGNKGYQYAMGKKTNIPGLFFSAPAFIEGHVVGVVVAKINLPALTHLVNQADSFITDEYGVIILAQDLKLEMRSVPDSVISGLSKVDRIARYKHEDFPVLSITPWLGRWGALQRFDDESEPVVLANKLLEENGIKVYTFMRIPEVIKFAKEQLQLFLLLSVFGAIVLLLIRARIILLHTSKQNEKQLRESEQRLLNMLNISPIGVRITTGQGRKIAFYNQRYAELIKNPDAMGDDPRRYYVRADDYDEMLSDLASGTAVMNRRIQLTIPDSSTIWTLASFMPMQFHGEDAVLAWFYDITPLKLTEEALHQAKIEAEAKGEKLQVLLESNKDDLNVANNIINHIMRSEGLRNPQIRYFQQPASQFSGDIIAAATDSNGDLRVMLADVTGHGLQAALFLLPISRVFYSMVKRGFKTGEIAKEMNQTMREIAVTGRFIAAAVAHIKRDGSSIEIWNGGIPTAFHIQGNGELHKFHSHHLPLGIINTEKFDATTEIFNTQSGAFLLCSDGLAEAENISGEQFGDERLEAIVNSSKPDELFENILSSLETHLGGGVAHDDLSIVLVQCSTEHMNPQTKSLISDRLP